MPANTFVATFEAVTQAGGVPGPRRRVASATYNLDPAAAEAAVSERTRYVLPVHLYGTPADMRALSDACAVGCGWTSSRTRARPTAPNATGSVPARPGSRRPSASTPARTSGRSAMPARRDDRRRRARRARRRASRARPAGEVPPSRSWARRPASTRSRRSRSCTSCRPRASGTSDGARAARFYGEALAGVGDLAPATRAGGRHAGLAPLRRSHRTPRRARRAPSGRAASGSASTIRSRRISHRHTPASATRAGSFPVTERLADEVLSLPMFPGIDGGAARCGREHGVRAFFERG